MDAMRFDRWTRTLSGGVARRRVGQIFGAAIVAATLGGSAGEAASACRLDRQPCRRGSQCCSGVCAGKNGKRRCRPATAEATCTSEKDACRQGEATGATDCGEDCWCWVTEAGASICGQLIDNARTCDDCGRIAPGLICVRGGVGECPAPFACVRPCFAEEVSSRIDRPGR
jgi:hypothetical protein